MMSLADCAYFAVLDTETTYSDEVMSIGAVISDPSSFRPADRLYVIIEPEYLMPSMYGYALMNDRTHVDAVVSRDRAVEMVRAFLDRYGVADVFAYNAVFDRSHLPEMWDYEWYDIMKLASNRNYNLDIPAECPCYSNGRMKRGYGAESILRMLCGRRYSELHNALADAEDELEIMRLIGQDLQRYEFTKLRGCGR